MKNDIRKGILPAGVIPESQANHLKKYAFDAAARSADTVAKILTGKEWRTLKADLYAQEIVSMSKSAGGGEEDDGDGDVCNSGLVTATKTMVSVDFDDEAETRCEGYSHLVDQLFQSFDNFKLSGHELEATNLALISEKFEQLSLVFKTNHTNMFSRSESTNKCHEFAVGRMKEICVSLNLSIQKMINHNFPEEINEDLCAIQHRSEELESDAKILIRTARFAGRMDLENRLSNMLESMVHYVQVLKTQNQITEDACLQARELLEDKGIIFLPSEDFAANPHQNSNTDDTATLTEDFDEMISALVMERFLAKSRETVRGEVLWPSNDTRLGLKQAFYGFITILGISIVAVNVYPIVVQQTGIMFM